MATELSAGKSGTLWQVPWGLERKRLVCAQIRCYQWRETTRRETAHVCNAVFEVSMVAKEAKRGQKRPYRKYW